MSKDQNPSDKACDAYFDNPYAATSGSYYSDRVTFYAGFAAGAASRDAEIEQLRAELAAAIAACKVKDEALNAMLERFGIMSDGCIKQASIAIAIQPDDSALKAWLGEPVAEVDDSGVVIVCRYDYKPKDKFYSPKGLK